MDGNRDLDDDTANDRTLLLRATTQELGPTRDAVLETAVRRTEVSQKQAAEAYTLAEARAMRSAERPLPGSPPRYGQR